MELIKINKEKHRAVYRLTNGLIRKYWYEKDFKWLVEHVELLKKFVPNYVNNYGENEIGVYIDMNVLPGITANTFPHTREFVEKVYKFCLENINETQPYVHGDWVLSNMLIDGDKIYLCDWDNLGQYPQEQVIKKLHSDLKSAFGNLFDEVLDDSASVQLSNAL